MATKKTTKRTTQKKAARSKKTSAKNAKPAAANGDGKKLSAIDAAAKVLAGRKKAMNAKELIEALAAKKLWTSPGGKTPHATLYAAILREIQNKGNESRFKKTERGKFAISK